MRKFTVEVRRGLGPAGRREFGERAKKKGHCRGEASVRKGSGAGLIAGSKESLPAYQEREVSRSSALGHEGLMDCAAALEFGIKKT